MVTEYHQKPKTQASNFVIQAEVIPTDQMKDFLTELVWSYRRAYFPGLEESLSLEEYKQSQKESETAKSSLATAFGHIGELGKVLQQALESDEMAEDTVNQLLDWSKRLPWPPCDQKGRYEAIANTVEDCINVTDRFAEEVLWPFTKIIRIFLDAEVLDTGVVLADLPGLSDVNLAKVKIAEEYLLNCHHLLIVGRIGRAASSKAIETNIDRIAKQYAPHDWMLSHQSKTGITVVCTMAEVKKQVPLMSCQLMESF